MLSCNIGRPFLRLGAFSLAQIRNKFTIALVNPNTPGNYRKAKITTSNYGLSMLSGFLQHYHKVDVTVIDGRAEMLTSEEAFERVSALKPNLVGVSLLVDESVDWTNGLFERLRKKDPRTHITVGSYFPSILPQQALDMMPEVDSIVVGEGEVTFSDLVHTLDREREWKLVPGINYRGEDGNVIKNIARAAVRPTDALPYPDRYMGHGDGGDSEAMIEGTRGCLFACTFCAVNSADKLPTAGPVRIRSADSLVTEMAALMERYPKLQGFRFVDSDFILPGTQKRAEEFADLLVERNVNTTIMCDLRAPSVIKYQSIVQKLQKAGLQRLYMGLESGSRDILKKMRKASTPEKNIEATRILREMGLDYSYGFMMITPWTEDRHVEENFDFLEKVGRMEFRCLNHEMTLIPGTTSYKRAEATNTLVWQGSLSYYSYTVPSPRIEKYRTLFKQLQKEYPLCFGEAAGYMYESLRGLHKNGFIEKFDYLEKLVDSLFLSVGRYTWEAANTDVGKDEFVQDCYGRYCEKFESLIKEFDPQVTFENCNKRIPKHVAKYQI
ncbi:MAG: hypothetical protein SP1CHLAM9_02380 [Chlamydiia bacterium]|nr:hypothetical protein [Chlamydiia bacterium]MCH9624456.1 hypothetical protein [Chlamydiia bacterium]